MVIELAKSVEILERTPLALQTMLTGLSDEWVKANEGDQTWSVHDVVGHLVHAEQTNWVPRLRVILEQKGSREFPPFDRFGHKRFASDVTLEELLGDFKRSREKSLDWLGTAEITEEDYDLEGIHPVFGNVNLGQLLATWTVHDLSHLAQIARVMSRQYVEAVGAWAEYLRILKS